MKGSQGTGGGKGSRPGPAESKCPREKPQNGPGGPRGNATPLLLGLGPSWPFDILLKEQRQEPLRFGRRLSLKEAGGGREGKTTISSGV